MGTSLLWDHSTLQQATVLLILLGVTQIHKVMEDHVLLCGWRQSKCLWLPTAVLLNRKPLSSVVINYLTVKLISMPENFLQMKGICGHCSWFHSLQDSRLIISIETAGWLIQLATCWLASIKMLFYEMRNNHINARLPQSEYTQVPLEHMVP